MELICEKLGYYGNMVSGSKSGYRKAFPKNLVIFNANLCTKEGKIWYGDIDITIKKDVLIELAYELNETLYILYEMDCRFENEYKPLIKNHVVRFTPEREIIIGDQYKNYELHKMLS